MLLPIVTYHVKPSGRYRVAITLLSLSRSRILRLLRPSSKSPRYRIGSRRGALTSSLDKALISFVRFYNALTLTSFYKKRFSTPSLYFYYDLRASISLSIRDFIDRGL